MAPILAGFQFNVKRENKFYCGKVSLDIFVRFAYIDCIRRQKMFYVTIRFANKQETQTFVSQASARIFATDLGDMFSAEEVWRDDNTFFVECPRLEIAG